MNTASCFLFGIGVGTAAGLLMAPRSGVKTRRLIADAAKDGQNYVKRGAGDVRNTVRDAVNRTTRAAKVTADGIGAAIELGKGELVG